MKIRSALSKLEPYHPGERKPGAIKLSSNENPRGCSPAAGEAIRKAIGEAHFYPDGSAKLLKDAVSRRFVVPPDWIILGNGSDEILTLIAASYINPGDRVLTGEHTFSQYAFATHLFDGAVTTVPMGDLRMDPDLFLDEIDGTVRVVFFCSPNNPTGLTISRHALERFMVAVPRDILVVMDHAYIEYQEDPGSCDALEHIREFPNLVVLRTFSKVHGLASLRVGFGIAHAERIQEMERARSPFNVNSMAQAAATAALSDKDFVHETLETNRRGKERLIALWQELNISWVPTEANFMMVAAPAGDGAAFARQLAGKGITVRALTSFGLPEHVRITIGTPDQLDTLERALRELLS